MPNRCRAAMQVGLLSPALEERGHVSEPLALLSVHSASWWFFPVVCVTVFLRRGGAVLLCVLCGVHKLVDSWTGNFQVLAHINELMCDSRQRTAQTVPKSANHYVMVSRSPPATFQKAQQSQVHVDGIYSCCFFALFR